MGCVLGKINVRHGDVLYMALEDSQRRLQERSVNSNMFGDGERPDLSRLTLVTQSPRQNEGGLNYIRCWLINHPGARLVIIETFPNVQKTVIRQSKHVLGRLRDIQNTIIHMDKSFFYTPLFESECHTLCHAIEPVSS